MQKFLICVVSMAMMMGRANASAQICSPFLNSNTGGINGCAQTSAYSTETFGRFACGVTNNSGSMTVHVGVVPFCSFSMTTVATKYTYETLGQTSTGTYTNLTQHNRYCFCRMVEPLLGAYVYSSKYYSTTGECLQNCASDCATVMTQAASIRAQIVNSVVGI